MRIRKSVRLLLGFPLICLVLVAALAGEAAQRKQRFVVDAKGLTVTDTRTGLVWQRDGSGPRPNCAHSPFCTWAEAVAYCSGLALDGPGWRLPTRDELESILNKRASGPAIDKKAFPDTPEDWFWTSSPYRGRSAQAWVVFFTPGGEPSHVGVNVSIPRVRCVR